MPIHIGIGSWGDDAYVGVLYPPGLPKSDRLREYARSLAHIEVNSTNYAIPPERDPAHVAQANAAGLYLQSQAAPRHRAESRQRR